MSKDTPEGQVKLDPSDAPPRFSRAIAAFCMAAGVLFATVGLAAAADEPSAQPSASPVEDAMFSAPYIDIDEWRDAPVRHRYVHGGFKGTETRFSFYFPAKDLYRGHFFQHITPVPDSENLAQKATGEEDQIGFSVESGAYFVETNGGGSAATGMPGSGVDPTIAAYRANAAAARYSRLVAAEMYGPQRTYGYAYGGSGGAYRTIGSIEHTTGVWDGAVPYVLGSSMAIPNVFTVRMQALRVLKDKFPQIVDAVEPGGSGDMYAGLDDEERDALREVTRMGFPPQSWFAYNTIGLGAFSVLYQGVVMADPTYFTDFWTVPGYLGANPTPSLLKSRIQFPATIAKAVSAAEAKDLGLLVGSLPGQARGGVDTAWQSLYGEGAVRPVGFRLSVAPGRDDFAGGDLVIKSGAAAGKRLSLLSISGDVVLIGPSDPKILGKLQPGDEVVVDNSNFLAAQTYHRHQVPGPEYYVWDQFRRPDGTPLYPQRKMLLGPPFTAAASGTVPTGKFEGKMILVESLWDREAYPWQADWYRSLVKANLGSRLDDNFRLWYTDHALHGDFTKQEDPTHTVSYLGVLHQALRDLSDWVEKGVPPPASTNYHIDDGQVVVPPTAADRRGIQPVVRLTVKGGARADIAVGQTLTFSGEIEVPSGTGKLVAAAWDFDGVGNFPVKATLPPAKGDRTVVTTRYRFAKPGTYFVTLRVASQRRGDAQTAFARIQNLDRVRVVVK